MQVFYHRVGTNQSDDLLIFDPVVAKNDPKWLTSAFVTNDGRFLLVEVKKGADKRNKVYYFDLDKLPGREVTRQTLGNQSLEFVHLIDNFEANYRYIHNVGEEFTFLTNSKASRNKIIRVNLLRPEPSEWTTLVAEDGHAVLEWATVVDKYKLVLCYNVNVTVCLRACLVPYVAQNWSNTSARTQIKKNFLSRRCLKLKAIRTPKN